MTKTTTLIALFGILIMQALTTVVYAQTANLESPSSEGVLLGLTNTSHETSKFAKSSNSTAMPGTPLVVPCGLGFSYNTPTCAGSSITLSVGGGTGYYYSWSTHATTQIISDIPKSDGSSVYSVTVTNSTGTCQDIHTTVPIQIIQPTYSITDILASNQLDCTTGNMTFQIQVSNPGNVANLQYSLDGTTWQSSNLFPNKSTDTYQGYVRATSNCTVTYQKFMEEFEPIEFGEIVKSNLGDCVLGNVGVSIQTTGGKVDGYRYRLNGGIWGNVPSYTGLTSGSYYFEAEPINISSGSCSRYMGFTIDETNGVSLTSLQKEQETDCVLANAAITALSNQPAAASVEYRLNAGAWQSSNRFTGLSSGNYTVDIRSTAGCPVAVSTLSTTVAERIYPKLQSIQVLRDRDCTTGNVQLNAVLQDASIAARYRLNGSTWTTTPSFTGLSSGTFTIEVSAPDVSTCSSSLSVTVQELGQVSITSNAVYNITDCVLGNITIEAKHNALTSTGLQFRINGGTWQSSNWFKGLSAGTYTIEGRVVGDAGCTFAIPGNTVTVTEVSGLTVVDTILLSNHTDCTIGNSRIQINLKQATTAQYRLVGVSNWQSSNIFTNRSTGRYIIEVRPTNAACTERDTVDIDEKTAVIGDLAVTGLTDCFHGNLRVEIPVTGTPLSQPFQYRLAGYSTPSAWQNGNVFANFPGFNYNRVEVKTSSGCIFSKSADFFETESIAVDISGLTYL
ncbi:hypothetical protein, partial [Haliscomenobacter sp.]|uniref:hypothetical protein n=1 Tax=Haliscomenobacter sp. TaxID=2717303 RepID=UPI003364CF90